MKYNKAIFSAIYIIISIFFIQFNVNSLNYDSSINNTILEESIEQTAINQTDFSIKYANNNLMWLVSSETYNMVFGCSSNSIFVYDRANNQTRIINEADGIGEGYISGLYYIESTNKLVVGVILSSPQLTRISVFNVPSISLNYSVHLENVLSYNRANMAYNDGQLFIATSYSDVVVLDVNSGSIIKTIEVPSELNAEMLDYDSINDYLFIADTWGSKYAYYDSAINSWNVFNISSDVDQECYIGTLKYIESLDSMVMLIRNKSVYNHHLAFFNITTSTLDLKLTPITSEQLPRQLAYDSKNSVIYFGSNSDWDNKIYKYFTVNQSFIYLSQSEGIVFNDHESTAVNNLNNMAYFSCANGLLEYNISTDTAVHISVGMNKYQLRNSFVTDEEYLYIISGDMSSFKNFEKLNISSFESVESYDLDIWGQNSPVFAMNDYKDSIFFAGQSGFKRYFKNNASFKEYAPEGVSDFRIFNIVKDEAAEKFYMTGKAANLGWDETYFWTFDINTQNFINSTLAMYDCDSYWEDFGPSSIYIPETNVYLFLGINETDYKYNLFSYNLTTKELAIKYNNSNYLYSLYYDIKTNRYFVGSDNGLDVLDGNFSVIKTIEDGQIRGFANFSQNILFTVSSKGLGVCNTSSLNYRNIVLKDGLPTKSELSEIKIDIRTNRLLIGSSLGLITYNIQNDTDYFNHLIQPPKFLYPNSGDMLTGSTKIYWENAIDSLTHSVTYDLHYSTDGGISWQTITSDLTSNSYNWDTTTVNDGIYKIKIIASCSEGLNSEDISAGTFEINNGQVSSTTTDQTTNTDTTSISTTSTSTGSDSSDTTESDKTTKSDFITSFTDINVITVAFISMSVLVLIRRVKK